MTAPDAFAPLGAGGVRPRVASSGNRLLAGGRLTDRRAVAGLLFGLAAAVCLRLGVAGPGGVRSPAGGLAFAGALALVALAGGIACRPTMSRGARPGWGDAVAGAGGALLLCAVPALVHLRNPGVPLPAGAFPGWAAVVTAVAVGEEWLLRGALFTAVTSWRGERAALALSTLAFGLLHVPFYGWTALPLDLAVGLLLGGLRQLTGSWQAPALAHTLADLAGWWLR